MLFARYPHCWGAQLLAKKLCVIFQVRAQSITKATLPGRPHREKLSSPYQPRCAPSTVHYQGLSPTSSQALTGICIPAPGTFIQRPSVVPLAKTFLRNLCKASLSRWEGKPWRHLLSTLTQCFSTPSLFLMFPHPPGPWNCKSLLFRLPRHNPVCADPPDRWPMLFHRKNGTGGVGVFSSLASCLYYLSKWLKAWLLYSFWFVVFMNYSNTRQLSFSSAELLTIATSHISSKSVQMWPQRVLSLTILCNL